MSRRARLLSLALLLLTLAGAAETAATRTQARTQAAMRMVCECASGRGGERVPVCAGEGECVSEKDTQSKWRSDISTALTRGPFCRCESPPPPSPPFEAHDEAVDHSWSEGGRVRQGVAVEGTHLERTEN